MALDVNTEGLTVDGAHLAAVHSAPKPRMVAPAAGDTLRAPTTTPSAIQRTVRTLSAPSDLIAMAASTGGPSTLTSLLQTIGPIAPPIVIAQHMPEFFTACFAQSLAEDTALTVREGRDRERSCAGLLRMTPALRRCLNRGWSDGDDACIRGRAKKRAIVGWLGNRHLDRFTNRERNRLP